MTSSATLSAGNGSGTTGQTVEIPLSLVLGGTAAPAGFQLDLDFDQQKLGFVSARVGQQLTSSGKTLYTSTLSNGDERLLGMGLNLNVIPTGVLAYVSFSIKSPFVSGLSTVRVLNCASTNTFGGALSTGCASGTIRALGCDINADGNANISDVQIMVNEVLGDKPAVHDLNQDGAVNVADLQIVINASLGLGCLVN